MNAEKLVSRIKTEVETRISEKNGYIYDVQQVDADITVWNKIFHRKKYKNALGQKEMYSDRINESDQVLATMESALNTAETVLEQAKKLDQNVVGQIGLCQQAIEGLDRQKTGIEREYEELHRRLSMKLEETERAKAEYVEMKQRMQKGFCNGNVRVSGSGVSREYVVR